ncbi:MAG: DNA primase [Anaeromyxobacteraceae bacterium]|nr:DNA primase [Anaeromyxobacteraceae bacterium]
MDVVAVIGRHVELKRAGRTWKGNCPFHGERTPSFHVYTEDKHYKCYGCGEYGNVFTFLQKLQGKEFPAVVRELAAEVGIEIPEADAQETAEAQRRRKERNELHAANDAAARYWAARLQSRFGEAARRYLASRGVAEEQVKAFRLGVAAEGWDDLSGRLKEKGIGAEALKKAGLLVVKEDGRSYDRFRQRLMFPITSLDGQVIGFGGRALGGEQGAKYLNTPETLLYKKSRVLYGIDLAREAIRRTRAAVLVEGYFDVIGLHQAGVKNAVAVCGTALTPEHVDLLKRCDCREVTVLFDGDVAGLAAPGKAAAALFPAGISGKVALLPAEAGKVDPDDYARQHGRAGVEALLQAAVPLSQFLLDRAVEKTCGPRPGAAALEAKLAAVAELAPLVRLVPEGLARSVFEDAIAKKLELDVGALREELAGARPPRRDEPPPDFADDEPPPDYQDDPAPAPAAGPAAFGPGPRGQGGQGRPWRAGPSGVPAARVRVVLPGAAADALGLLAAFPELAPIAEEENLPGLLPPGPLADLARDLLREPAGLEAALARRVGAVDEVALNRIRALGGPGRPEAATAGAQLRKACVKAAIELVVAEQGRLHAEIARQGSPVPEELLVKAQVAARRRADLERRLREQGAAG